LMFQPQEKLHDLLEHGDRVVALLLRVLWRLIAFRGYKLIEHGVVLLELLVQPLIVGFLADVNDGDQVDFDTLLAAGGGVLGDRSLEGDGSRFSFRWMRMNRSSESAPAAGSVGIRHASTNSALKMRRILYLFE